MVYLKYGIKYVPMEDISSYKEKLNLKIMECNKCNGRKTKLIMGHKKKLI